MVLLGLLRQGSRICSRLTKNLLPSLPGANGQGSCVTNTSALSAGAILCRIRPITISCTRFLSNLTPAWRAVDITGGHGRFQMLNSITAQHWNSSSLLGVNTTSSPNFVAPHRHHIKFSRRQGKQKTVKAATRRFFMLRWGAFIRPIVGRDKRLWRKDWKRRQRNRRHVFCNSTQNQLLRHMMTGYWKRPRYYVDDPYEPYHVRNGVYRTTPKYPLTYRSAR